MAPAQQPNFQLIVTQPERAVVRLHRLVGPRMALRAVFQESWCRLSADAAEPDLEIWAERMLELAHVNAGPACLIAALRMSETLASASGLSIVAAGIGDAAELCRRAGAAAAHAAMEAMPQVLARLGAPDALALWWRSLVRLAAAAPESVAALARQSGAILERCDAAGFSSFVSVGLKLTGSTARPDRRRRLAFFSLEDPAARQLLETVSAEIGFRSCERGLRLFLTALFGGAPKLRAAAHGETRPRRTSVAGDIILMPETYRGVPASQARLLFRAAAAHAACHFAFGSVRQPVGSLMPLQLSLITVIEDARVEALAMRRFPGLRELWSGYHIAKPTGVTTAAGLLARLARALFDPDYRDDNAFIARGRSLFADEMLPALDDPITSRRIGGLLGNDLGQQRLQFNPRTYVIEPAYRDDGLGFWEGLEGPPPQADTIDLMVEAVRPQTDRRSEPQQTGGDADPAASRPTSGRARPAGFDERGPVIGIYPEWDREAGTERPTWTTVRDVAVPTGDPSSIDALVAARPELRDWVARMLRRSRIGRPTRLRRQPDGPELDLDAAIETEIDRRLGEAPDLRVYRTTVRRHRDAAVTILLDCSESMRAGVAGLAATALDIQRQAVALVAEAMQAGGDPLALRAFASAGREDVRLLRIKEFDEPWQEAAKARLAGIAPGFSTRIGAALRHAGSEMAALPNYRRLILVLTDGEASDIDVTDPLDLVEDARRVSRALKFRGIDVFGVTLASPDDTDASVGGAAIFGRGNWIALRRIEDLPRRLSELYFRLLRH
jgi:nitric oxide reductase NorD protein